MLGCADSDGTFDELGEETAADGEDGKGDAAAAFTFYNLLPDTRACSFDSPPDCGQGLFISRANRASTKCGDGGWASKCRVTSIDWTGTAMPASITKNYEEELRAGKPLLVRGSLAAAPAPIGSLASVTEIWLPNKSDWADGAFTLVKSNGLECATDPCPSLTERRLNSNLSADISSLDLDPSGATPDEMGRALSDVYGDGLIVVGYRYTDSDGGKGRTANKFFTKAVPPML